jgi:hypothetical protein
MITYACSNNQQECILALRLLIQCASGLDVQQMVNTCGEVLIGRLYELANQVSGVCQSVLCTLAQEAVEPQCSYAIGVLGIAMDSDAVTQYRDENARLMPRVLQSLRILLRHPSAVENANEPVLFAGVPRETFENDEKRPSLAQASSLYV